MPFFKFLSLSQAISKNDRWSHIVLELIQKFMDEPSFYSNQMSKKFLSDYSLDEISNAPFVSELKTQREDIKSNLQTLLGVKESLSNDILNAITKLEKKSYNEGVPKIQSDIKKALEPCKEKIKQLESILRKASLFETNDLKKYIEDFTDYKILYCISNTSTLHITYKNEEQELATTIKTHYFNYLKATKNASPEETLLSSIASVISLLFEVSAFISKIENSKNTYQDTTENKIVQQMLIQSYFTSVETTLAALKTLEKTLQTITEERFRIKNEVVPALTVFKDLYLLIDEQTTNLAALKKEFNKITEEKSNEKSASMKFICR